MIIAMKVVAIICFLYNLVYFLVSFTLRIKTIPVCSLALIDLWSLEPLETTPRGGPDPQGAQRALRPPLRGPTGSIWPPRPKTGQKGQKGPKGLKSAENGPGSPKRAFGASGQASGRVFSGNPGIATNSLGEFGYNSCRPVSTNSLERGFLLRKPRKKGY